MKASVRIMRSRLKDVRLHNSFLISNRIVYKVFFIRHYFFQHNCAILSHAQCASLAQLDRAFGYEPEGRGFKSRRAYHKKIISKRNLTLTFFNLFIKLMQLILK